MGARREIDDALPVRDGKAIGKERDRLRRVCRHCSEGSGEFVTIPCREISDGQSQPLSGFFGVGAPHPLRTGVSRQGGDPRNARRFISNYILGAVGPDRRDGRSPPSRSTSSGSRPFTLRTTPNASSTRSVQYATSISHQANPARAGAA